MFEQCSLQPLWVLGMRCLHLSVRALSKVLLLPVWVWLVLPSTTYSKRMLPLDLWCQASLQGLPERQHLGKTVHCWGLSDRIVSWVLGPWRRGWEICTEWGLVAQWLTTDSCPVVTGHIDPQRSPCWLPTTVVSAWSGRRGGPLAACHLQWLRCRYRYHFLANDKLISSCCGAADKWAAPQLNGSRFSYMIYASISWSLTPWHRTASGNQRPPCEMSHITWHRYQSPRSVCNLTPPLQRHYICLLAMSYTDEPPSIITMSYKTNIYYLSM